MSEVQANTRAPEEIVIRERPGDPCVLALFGAGGDLTGRLLGPALYNMAKYNVLPQCFALVGLDRKLMTDEEFRQNLSQTVQKSDRIKDFDPTLWGQLAKRFHYVTASFDEAEGYHRLAERLAQCDRDWSTQGNYLFYTATPPRFFGKITQQLGAADLAQERKEDGRGWRRIIIEKPFGRDLETARELNRTILESFAEHQIYRIDHYLGKETVQNFLVYRLANGFVEPIWNRHYIDHVQMTAAETIGVEKRGGYYDQAGVMRDMIETHMFQLLALMTMEPPNTFGADAVRDEKAKVLRAVRLLSPEEVVLQTVRGQYGEGNDNGQRLAAYRDEPDVSPTSNTETYAAVKLFIDNWRWEGVPFYLRSGKMLPKRLTEVVIQFRQVPHVLFDQQGCQPSRLIFSVQPEERITTQIEAKVPGPRVRTQSVSMEFRSEDYFEMDPITGYETLLYDAMIGDATLFHRSDIVEAAWRIATPILDVWQTLPPRDFPNYPARNAWGPAAADTLIQRDGREWRQL